MPGVVSASGEHDEGPRPSWAFLAVALLAAVVLTVAVVNTLGPKDLGLGPEVAGTGDEAHRVRLRLVLTLAPALGLLLAAFHPPVLAALRALEPRRAAALVAGLAVWTFLAPATRFDPYWTVLLALWAAVPLLALRLDPEPGRLTPLVLLVWLAWWIPFDLRWFQTLWTGPRAGAYDATALLVSVLACVAFGARTRAGGDGGRGLDLRPPSGRDVGVGLLTLVAFGALAIPIGVAVGFLHPTWPPRDGAAGAVLRAFTLAFTVALPEELYFRGVLDAGLRPHFRRAWTSLAISSVAFGLMHWNNRDPNKTGTLLAYLVLASVAGVFYGLAYRRSGLWAAVTAHTLVDLVWQLVLRGR